MKRWVSYALVAVVVAATTAAAAEPIPEKARALASRGRAAHDRRDYAAAIAAFTEAYAIAPAPALLFNLAQAYRLKGSCDDAALMYRRYLGANPSYDGRVLAEAHLATVERCIQNRTLRVTVEPQLTALAIPSPPPPVETHRPVRHRTDKIGAGLAVAGGTALLVAGFYSLHARQTETDVERRYAGGEKWPKLAKLDAEGDRAATTAKVVGITGVAALAAGVTFLVVDRRKQRHTLRVEPTARGARIGARWDF
jgi:tetratricopeptide (TPR) repeat protein